MESLMGLLEREIPVLPAPRTDGAEVLPAAEPDPLEGEVLLIAERAKDTFGYDALLNRIRGDRQRKVEESEARNAKFAEERELLRRRAEARSAFATLGIQPYSPTSVGNYKQAMLDRAEDAYYIPDPSIRRRLVYKVEWIWIALSLVVVPLCCVRLTGMERLLAINGWVALLLVALLILRLKALPRVRRIRDRIGYEWKRTELKSYENGDPEITAALVIALQLQDRLPDAMFYVDALCKKPEPPRPAYVSPSPMQSAFSWEDDPFIVMAIAGEEHYVAVWGEPEYERTQHP